MTTEDRDWHEEAALEPNWAVVPWTGPESQRPFNAPPTNPAARLIWALFMGVLGSNAPSSRALVNSITSRGRIRDDGHRAFFEMGTTEGTFHVVVTHDDPPGHPLARLRRSVPDLYHPLAPRTRTEDRWSD